MLSGLRRAGGGCSDEGKRLGRDGGMGAGSLCFRLWGVDLSRTELELRASFVETSGKGCGLCGQTLGENELIGIRNAEIRFTHLMRIAAS